MTARPIIFSAPMIRALLAGEKTQTRRIAKVTDKGCKPGFVTPMAGFTPRRPADHVAYCPYGQPGDLLWVRETWFEEYDDNTARPFTPPRAIYRATEQNDVRFMDDDGFTAFNRDGTMKSPWRPSIHMPRWASRLTLRVTDVRVQRVQEISEADARAEGVTDGGCVNCGNNEPCGCANPLPCARDSFISIWYNIHGPASWLDNPYVWALTFDVIHKNVDEVRE